MITRWEEVVAQTAKEMGLPYHKVEAEVLRMAQFTENHLISPRVMETDLLGIGALKARYGRLKSTISTLKQRRYFQQQWADKFAAENPARAAEYTEKVEAYSREIAQLEAFITQKAIMSTMSKRSYTLLIEADEQGKKKELPKHKEKILLTSKKLRGGKRRAKRVKNWKPPVLLADDGAKTQKL